MKKAMMLSAAVVLLAIPVYPAVQYEFVQRTTTEGAVVPNTELNGRALLDGSRSRIEFTGGDVYPAGTYVVSVDGSKRLYFVDPLNKWYTEVNTAGVASAVAASNIEIANLKSNLEKIGDNEVIAGQPTVHYKLTITYDITVPTRVMPLRQTVKTVIQTWTTVKYGDIARDAFSNSVRTGNVEVDKLVETETTKVQGLPLRQSVAIMVTSANPKVPGSQVPLPTTRTITRDTWVTKIGETTPDPMAFKIPATYRKSEQPDAPAPPLQVLDMQPVGK